MALSRSDDALVEVDDATEKSPETQESEAVNAMSKLLDQAKTKEAEAEVAQAKEIKDEAETDE